MGVQGPANVRSRRIALLFAAGVAMGVAGYYVGQWLVAAF